jgi:hypothetical protein
MRRRNKYETLIAQAMSRARDVYDPLIELWTLQISCLSPKKRAVFDWIVSMGREVKSPELAAKMNWQLNNASNYLNDLTALGLLRCLPGSDGVNRYAMWLPDGRLVTAAGRDAANRLTNREVRQSDEGAGFVVQAQPDGGAS